MVVEESPNRTPSILCHLPSLGDYSPAGTKDKLEPKQQQASGLETIIVDNLFTNTEVEISDEGLSSIDELKPKEQDNSGPNIAVNYSCNNTKAKTLDDGENSLVEKEDWVDDKNSLLGTEEKAVDENRNDIRSKVQISSIQRGISKDTIEYIIHKGVIHPAIILPTKTVNHPNSTIRRRLLIVYFY